MTSTVPAPTSLSEVPTAVEEVLRGFLDPAIATADAIAPVVGDATRVVADFVLSGGKRVRPTFAYAGWLCGRSAVAAARGAAGATGTGETEPDEGAVTDADALRVCAALELVQACALVHDDIIDHSDTRRGRPTVHRVFERRHADAQWHGDAAEHGVAAAILAGDLALAWADDLVHGHTPFTAVPAGRPVGTGSTPRALPARVGLTWAAMRTEVLAGQFLDIVNEVSGDESVAAAYRVMEFKTAAYTVARPLELGATLAGAPETLIDDLRSVGRDLGLAFQLRDDLLGVFGDPERTGKPSGDDLVAGKRTALLAVGLTRAQDTDPGLADDLRSVIGTELSPEELSTARGILVDVGAVHEVEREIDALLDSAVNTLRGTEIGDDIRTELIAMAHRIAHRDA
ncbi:MULTISPECIES: polyprenyl synthetase family protein [unclassified Gordonia (in: high G+C Gram-positive bacteria)]